MASTRKEDPRTIRTKRMFKEAVFSLLAEHQDLSQLTVQKIANRAELNRATFYLHYEDIHDLLRQLVHEILDELSTKVNPLLQGPSVNDPESLTAFLTYFHEYREIFAVLVENPEFKTRLTQLIESKIRARREARTPDSSAKGLVAVEVMASSLLGIILWWIKDGTRFSAEELAGQITLLYKKKHL
ncbi:TetR/AcrR family transcriptional regulator [Gorillibacterium sp. sgz500922]|uniref:TetR/AcrR family transcriptional regulator n=1 Tax=Gorillibacterium sp. sgz500922 TaxID=3446694 RepID=UPI003F67FBDC